MRGMILQIAIGVLFLQCLLAADSGTIQWYQDFDRASRAAGEANKPLMLDFWADWCAPCKVMEKEVYSDKSLIEVTSRKFFPVKIDFDKEKDLVRKYNVTALPYIVFTDSYGAELFHYEGFISAKTLTELVKALPGDVSEINRLNRILAKHKNNFEALEGMGKSLRAAGLYHASNDYYEKALQRPEAKATPPRRDSMLLAMGLNYLELKQSVEAIQTFEAGVKEFPHSENNAAFLLGLGQAYAIGGKKDKARKLLETFLREHPGSRESEKAKALLDSL